MNIQTIFNNLGNENHVMNDQKKVKRPINGEQS